MINLQMVLGGFATGLALGAWGHRLAIDGLMLAQKKSHESEKEFMWEEMRRLRTQVANLIGKE